MWWLALGILVLLLHIIFPKKYNSLSFERKISKIPGPTRVPYFGNPILFTLKPEQFIGFLEKLYKQYKPLFRIDFLGYIYVGLTDLDDLKTVLNGADHISKSHDYKYLVPWLGTGLLTSTGEKWHNHRKWLTPAFHFKIVDQYIDTINKNANDLVEQLMAHEKDDYVNINKLMTLCTLDIICETAMGVTIGAQKGGEEEYVRATIRMSQMHQIIMLSPWLRCDKLFDFYPTGKEQKKVLKILHGFSERVIKKRKLAYLQRKTKKEEANDLPLGQKVKKSFLDLLIENSQTQNKITETEIREEVDTFMFEGHDTTSAALCWAIHLLGSHSEIQEKAYLELQEIFGDSNRDPTHADIAQMKYLERIIKETLRLYPSVPFIGRKSDKDIKIRDYVIPAGAGIAIPVYCIHRDPRYYPDPLKFDPDRFLPEAVIGRQPFSYIPFSAGPRNCIGQRFAMVEEKVVLSHILRKFVITSLETTENIKISAELILRPINEGLRIAFKPRKFNSPRN